MSSNSIQIGGVAGLQNLLKGASTGDDALVSTGSSQVLAGGANALTAFGAAGADLTKLKINEALNIWILVDRSASMANNVQAVTTGQNGALDLLAKDRRSKEMMLSQWEFGGDVEALHPPVPLVDAVRYGKDRDYVANGGSTRLFASWRDMLTAAVAQHQYNEDESDTPIPTTTVCVVITDGDENHLYAGPARTKFAKDLQTLAGDLLKSERFILAFMGVDSNLHKGSDPKSSRFWTAAKEMGFPDGCIGVDADLLRVFARVSTSVSQVSSGQVQPGAKSTFFS